MTELTKKYGKVIAIWILIVSIHSTCLFAQNQKIGYSFPSTKTKIPFQLVNGNIVVKGSLNEHNNLSFIIDTGATATIVFTDETIHPPISNKSITLKGFGELDSLVAPISIYNTISLHDLQGNNQSILLIPKGTISVDEILGRPIHGVIGYDLFAYHKVTIDFINHKLIIEKSHPTDTSANHWLKIPLELYRNTPTVPAEVVMENGNTVSIKLLLDTGAGVPLILDSRFAPESGIPTSIGYGLMGDVSGQLGKIKQIEINEIKLTGVVAAFSDKHHFNETGASIHLGNLGPGFFNRNKIRIDYENERLEVRYKRRISKYKFHYNRSGISIRMNSKRPCGIEIDKITPGSVADSYGLKPGDQIRKLNKIECEDLTPEKVTAILNDMSLKSINMRVERGKEKLTFVIPLTAL